MHANWRCSPLLVGREAVGTGLHVNYVVRLERGARGDGGGEGARGVGGGDVVPVLFPKVAGRAREVRWGAGVDAALVAGTGGRPGTGVVAALFDGGGGALGTGG